jgi:selenocysteine lyase/cysteine desulfurase
MSDPLESLVGNAEEFPSLRRWDFFNHAGASPLPKVVADTLRQYVDDTESSAYLVGNRYAELPDIRATCARAINADADEIALLKNTAEGISIVAHAIDWKPGDRVVTAAGEYPANIYPWIATAVARGAELVIDPQQSGADGSRFVPIEDILREAAHDRTRLVTLSHVEYGNGQRFDLATIGAFCRERGIVFCVDAIQSLGAVPVDVKAMQVDYLAAGGQKWLLGPEGSALFYCRKELLDRTPPLVVGASNVANPTAFDRFDYTLAPSAARYESGTYNIAGCFAMRVALKLLFERAGGDAVSARIKLLTDRLVAGLRSRGYQVASPRGGDQWSGIVSFSSPLHDPAAVARTLRKEQRTEVVVREGRLRASPHFYQTGDHIDRLVEHLPAH